MTGIVPDPADEADEAKRAQMERMLSYMALTPGQKIAGTHGGCRVHRLLHQFAD